ncbi:MAG: ABC transporter permease [Planctomycetota bacterium]|nr:ABC transporter permease [Planctomycetota bacterium]
MNTKRLMALLGPFVGLLFVVILFGALEPSFLSTRNLMTVAIQTVIVGLGAIGMTFVIVSGGIDLSIGSVIALASVVTALSARAGLPTPVAVMAGVTAGGLCGALNGWLVTRLSIVPFIVTLGMMGVARGVAKWLSAEQTVTPSPEASDALALLASKTATSPGIWITILLAVLMALVLKRTVFGVHTYALGSNEDTARLCGVPVERTKVWIYTLCGIFGGLGGVMTFARLSVGDPTTAIGKELDVIAAVVIGGASLSGGKGSILGSMVGALLMAALANGCNLTGVPNFVQEILIGSIIVAAVAVDRVRSSRR